MFRPHHSGNVNWSSSNHAPRPLFMSTQYCLTAPLVIEHEVTIPISPIAVFTLSFGENLKSIVGNLFTSFHADLFLVLPHARAAEILFNPTTPTLTGIEFRAPADPTNPKKLIVDIKYSLKPCYGDYFLERLCVLRYPHEPSGRIVTEGPFRIIRPVRNSYLFAVHNINRADNTSTGKICRMKPGFFESGLNPQMYEKLNSSGCMNSQRPSILRAPAARLDLLQPQSHQRRPWLPEGKSFHTAFLHFSAFIFTRLKYFLSSLVNLRSSVDSISLAKHGKRSR